MKAEKARKIVRAIKPVEILEGEHYEAICAIVDEQRSLSEGMGALLGDQDDRDLMLCMSAFAVGRAAGVGEERERQRSKRASD